MRLLIVSEGTSELGGALETFVRRLLEIEFAADFRKISDSRALHWQGKGLGHFKRAVKWLMYAHREKYDAVVIVIDRDRPSGRKEDPVQQYRDAQATDLAPIRRALGVAIRTFDAWMLADEVAFARVVGRTVAQQPDPESIKEPKVVCRQLRDQHGSSLSLQDLYTKIAETARFEILETRCSKGFAPFADRVRQLRVSL